MSAPSQFPPEEVEAAAVDEVVRQGPFGAAVVAFLATACVVAMWFAFYAFVFVPRGSVP